MRIDVGGSFDTSNAHGAGAYIKGRISIADENNTLRFFSDNDKHHSTEEAIRSALANAETFAHAMLAEIKRFRGDDDTQGVLFK